MTEPTIADRLDAAALSQLRRLRAQLEEEARPQPKPPPGKHQAATQDQDSS